MLCSSELHLSGPSEYLLPPVDDVEAKERMDAFFAVGVLLKKVGGLGEVGRVNCELEMLEGLAYELEMPWKLEGTAYEEVK